MLNSRRVASLSLSKINTAIKKHGAEQSFLTGTHTQTLVFMMFLYIVQTWQVLKVVWMILDKMDKIFMQMRDWCLKERLVLEKHSWTVAAVRQPKLFYYRIQMGHDGWLGLYFFFSFDILSGCALIGRLEKLVSLNSSPFKASQLQPSTSDKAAVILELPATDVVCCIKLNK